METKETKICKHCQTEIPKKAKVCPNCRKKQGGIGKWIAIAVVVLLIFGFTAGGGDDSSNVGTENKNEEPINIEYISVTIDEMSKELEENAVVAYDKYKDQYLEITGTLSTIDSEGSYISLYPDEGFLVQGVQCFIENDEQLEIVKGFKKGEKVTVRGKCTEVGEILGFTLYIDEIVQ